MDGSKSVRTICATILLAGLAPLALADDADAAYEAGLQAAQDFHHAQALDYFNRAAERGDRDALRSAGLMRLYGQDLYGEAVHTRTGSRPCICWPKPPSRVAACRHTRCGSSKCTTTADLAPPAAGVCLPQRA